MFNKIGEHEFRGRFNKIYKTQYEVLDLINYFSNSDYGFKSLKIRDNGDVGMKGFGGGISLEELNNNYYEYYPCIDFIIMEFEKNDVFLNFNPSGTIIFNTPNKEEEIQDLIEKKTKQL